MMPHFSLIIQGHWRPARADFAGFVTYRTTRAENLDVAAEKVEAELRQEWLNAPAIPNGAAGLQLSVLEGWRTSPWAAWWGASGGHALFESEHEAADAASITAQAAQAAKGAAIWRIATQPGLSKSEFYVTD